MQLSDTWKNGLKIGFGVLAIYLGFRFVLPLVFPFVIAGVIAVILFPVIRKVCEHFRILTERKKKCVTFFLVSVFYIILFALLSWLLVSLWKQGKSLFLNVPFYQAKCTAFVKGCCCKLDETFHIGNGTSYVYVSSLTGKNWDDSVRSILSKMTGYSMQMFGRVFSLIFAFMATVLSTFLLILEHDQIRNQILKLTWGQKICDAIQTVKATLFAYVKAQGLVMGINGVVCVVAFWLIGQPYYILLGVFVAIFDALPVLGAGAILLPYALFYLVKGQMFHAVILLLTYMVCVMIRQLVEARLIGEGIGMKPLYTIMSMYVGYQLFGVLGFLLGPIAFLILKEFKKSLD
ncbi:MAG: AI-2E family transporter [Eubacteriales bacterium]|nr:AI-2E family transporter [Eubacteriales bacterium]